MSMQKLEHGAPESQSADLPADNLARLRALFPELVAEGPGGPAVNVDVLKALVGDATVTDAEEKYGLNWHGKRAARQLALTPSTGTLRPCPNESVDWDSTKNLMIEGDNLEVLKLLQKSYAGKVKLIYIDPPYNTGKDFVYPDRFQDSVANYLELTGQRGGGARISSNSETSGRFHTDWLNMMFPRLKLARDLLRADGALFISIDDKEVANLRGLCDEVFGAENLVAQMVWEGANKNDAKQIGTCHEYVLVYARNRDAVPREWGLKKDGVEPVLKEAKRLREIHGSDFDSASEALAGWFRAMKATESFAHRRYRFIDVRGVYKEENPTAPGGRRFQLVDPRNGNKIRLREGRGWAFDQDQFNKLVEEGRITFVTETSIMLRLYLHETDSMTPPSVFYQPARSASERLSKLMGQEVFDFPKDELILRKFVEMATSKDDHDCIVMDFFAGSGTTAHAVLLQNATDRGQRRFVLVQLPEPLDPSSSEQRDAAAYCDKLGKPRNIAELTKERVRRAAEAVRADNPLFGGDCGFRVLKLDLSNIRAWNPTSEAMKETLFNHAEHLLPDRTDDDLFTELMLKLGLDVCVPTQTRSIVGKQLRSIAGGVLIACLDRQVQAQEVESLAQGIVAWHKELSPAGDTTCVFRDSAFADDVTKTNMAAILEQNGIANVRSL